MVIGAQRDIECAAANPEDHCPLVFIRFFESKGEHLIITKRKRKYYLGFCECLYFSHCKSQWQLEL